jgi:hypothetical protein
MNGEPVNFSYGLDTLATRGGRIEELVPLLESLKREHAHPNGHGILAALSSNRNDLGGNPSHI